MMAEGPKSKTITVSIHLRDVNTFPQFFGIPEDVVDKKTTMDKCLLLKRRSEEEDKD